MRPGFYWYCDEQSGEWLPAKVTEVGREQFVTVWGCNGMAMDLALDKGHFGPELRPPEDRRKPHRHGCASPDPKLCRQRGYCLCDCGDRCVWEDGNKIPDGTVWITFQEVAGKTP